MGWLWLPITCAPLRWKGWPRGVVVGFASGLGFPIAPYGVPLTYARWSAVSMASSGYWGHACGLKRVWNLALVSFPSSLPCQAHLLPTYPPCSGLSAGGAVAASGLDQIHSCTLFLCHCAGIWAPVPAGLWPRQCMQRHASIPQGWDGAFNSPFCGAGTSLRRKQKHIF